MRWLLLVALLGCEQTGLIRFDAGADQNPDGPPAAGPDASGQGPSLVSFRYTPTGCEYEVATPEVRAASMGADVYGDEPAPRQIHVAFAGPAESSFNVNWQTDESTLATRLLYGTDEAAVRGANSPGAGVTEQLGHRILFANAGLGVGNFGNTHVHEVHVCGLQPGTRYYYKVGGPAAWSEVFDVATSPAIGTREPWSFAVTGDSRNNEDNSWPMSQRRVFDRGVDLEVFTGDAVRIGTYQQDWDDFFSLRHADFGVQDLLARVPFMPVNGNHDALSVNYVAQFGLPQHQSSPEEGAQGEEWYSFDFGNAHFVMLNDSVADNGVLGGAQASWLRDDLSRVDRDRTPWVFAAHHRPFYTCLSTHQPDQGLRTAWQPIFDELEVDIVFTGHNHVYERSEPIRGLEGGQGRLAPAGVRGVPVIDGPGAGSGSPSGTIYIVAAGVGAPLYSVSDSCPFTNQAQQVRNYVHVQLEHRTIRFTVYDAMSDAVIDEFTYTK